MANKQEACMQTITSDWLNITAWSDMGLQDILRATKDSRTEEDHTQCMR